MPKGLRRSLLFVPAINARAIDKARTLPCDAVILDLEDSVAPEAKDQAREAAVAAIRSGFGGRETALRINPMDSPWGVADLRAAAAVRPDVVVLPKVSAPEQVLSVGRGLGDATEIWAMIESCLGVIRAPDIAAASAAVSLGALMVGANDLAAEMRCRLTPGREALLPILTQTVIAARAFGLSPLDSTFVDLEDHGGFEGQCRQGAELGFDGKSLIHPSQIEAANRQFSPSAERIAWARRVIAAYEAEPDAGVLAVDGQMVERLHLTEALRIAAFALSAG
jgi:citrate lyase subunit beta/citryl-CoA lyase